MVALVSGMVVAVTSAPVATQVVVSAFAGDTVVRVDDTADFVPTGGQVTIDDGEVLTYTVADDDVSSLTFAAPLPADALEDAVVAPYPPRVDVTALVLVDGESDPIPATVPRALQDVLQPGVRNPDSQEQVHLTPSGDYSWSVFDVAGDSVVRFAPTRVTDDTGGILGGVDPFGNISAADLSYTGVAQLFSDTAYVDGVTLVSLLDLLPKGVLRRGSRTPNVTGIGASEYAVASLTVQVPRDCEATITLNGKVTASAADVRFANRIRYTYNATAKPTAATNSSPVLSDFNSANDALATGVTPGAAGGNQTINATLPTQLSAGWYNLRWTLASLTSSATLNTTAPFSMRVIDEGPAMLANGVYASGSPGTLDPGGTDTGSTGGDQAQFYTRTYAATDAKWWTGGGTFGGAGDNQYFGNTSSTGDGNRKSVIWFPKSTIVSDLAGATVTKVELYLYLHNGGDNNTVAVGKHNDTTPGSDVYTDVDGTNRELQTFPGWDEGTGKWVTLTDTGLTAGWGTSGSIAGVVIGPQSNNTDKYAAGFRGATHSQHPKLRITYTT